MPLPDFLIDRYIDWKNNSFKKNKQLYEKLVTDGQKPKAMVISCCDSRVNISSIFGANIGDFFIHRNIANLVPPFNPNKDYHGTSAAIEYAIKNLKVPHIIILGHSNCGGIDYGYNSCSGHIKSNYEFIDQWIEILKPAFENVESIKTKEDKINLLEKESIKNSIKNLVEFPFVNALIKNGKLNVHGLWFDILTGKLMNLNFNKNKFENIIHE
tara:strand:- start:59 stop:697 length:639 start_codon:yes stop_codon:yes gene_type:complete